MNEFTVQYERKYSDGNYGSEGLSLSWTFAIDEEDLNTETVTASIAMVKRVVLGELGASKAERVAWAAAQELGPPRPAKATDEEEDIPF
jgi:hypothetical protein